MTEIKVYSQLEQDQHIYRFYRGKRGGRFVEVGANDGVLLSNTKMLEESFGWRGVCIEPNPQLYPKLVANRPLAFCSPKAAYSVSGKVLDFQIGVPTETVRWDLLSGLVQDLKEGDNKRGLEQNNGPTVQVETATLTEVLDEAKMPAFT